MDLFRKPLSAERAFGLSFALVAAVTLVCLVANIATLQGTWCLPMYGTTNGLHVNAFVATAVTLALSALLLKTFEFEAPLPHSLLFALFATGGIGLGLYVTLDSLSDLTTFLSSAQTSTYTVTLSKVEGDGPYPNVDEPDCLWAYYFRNPATGLRDFQCTDSEVPLKVGTKVHLESRTNYFGSCIMKFEPIPGHS